jgi:hypothetical protein
MWQTAPDLALLGVDPDPFFCISWEGDVPVTAETCPTDISFSGASELSGCNSHLSSLTEAEDCDGSYVQRDFGTRQRYPVGAGLSMLQVVQPGKGTRKIRWENFITSFGRALKKTIKICQEIKQFGEKSILNKYRKLHAIRKHVTTLVPVHINSRSERHLLALSRVYAEINRDGSLTQYAKTFTGPRNTDGHSKEASKVTRPSSKTWNFYYQRMLFQTSNMRKFFYYFVQFLDYFGECGEGVQLCAALNVECEDVLGFKCGLLFQYMKGLGLEPFDGKEFAQVFAVQRTRC